MSRPLVSIVPTRDRYEIDKGIPIPPPKRAPEKYPFAAMKVGDSFFAQGDAKILAHRISSACRWYSRLHPGVKFTQRTKEHGVRVWRVA